MSGRLGEVSAGRLVGSVAVRAAPALAMEVARFDPQLGDLVAQGIAMDAQSIGRATEITAVGTDRGDDVVQAVWERHRGV